MVVVRHFPFSRGNRRCAAIAGNEELCQVRDTVMPDSEWPWPESLDALAAAPAHHTRLLENDRVRVVHTHIPPGDTVPVHTHRFPGIVYVVRTSDFVRRDDRGNVLFDSRRATAPAQGVTVQWLDPLPPHSVENVGSAEISLIIVELKTGAK
jgi:predicted metal-dependent enzyme (double-stranded beta helix superfamily)